MQRLSRLQVRKAEFHRREMPGLQRRRSGREKCPQGKHLLRMQSNSSLVASWTTGADGRFLFKSIEPGEYRVRAVRPSFYPAFYEFVLRQREPVELEIVLQKEQSASEKVEVRVQHLTIDPQK